MNSESVFSIWVHGLKTDDFDSRIPNRHLEEARIYLNIGRVTFNPVPEKNMTKISFKPYGNTGPDTGTIYHEKILDAIASAFDKEYYVIDSREATIKAIISDYNLPEIAANIQENIPLHEQTPPKIDLRYADIGEGMIKQFVSMLKQLKRQRRANFDELTITEPGTEDFCEIIDDKIMIKDMNIP